MSIFNTKKEYSIVTNMDTNEIVRKFAEEHSAEGCGVDVHVHGCLLEGNNLVTITFKTDMEEALLFTDMVDVFNEQYKLAIRRKLIFVFNKEEESD